MTNARILDDVTLEDVERCPVCSSPDHMRLFSAHDTLHGFPGEWTVRRCSSCGHCFTSPRPTRESIFRFYPDDYGPFSSPVVPSSHSIPKRWLSAVAGHLLDPLEALWPPGEPGTALEVGCGSGRFLSELDRRGWTACGLEPSASTAKRAEAAVRVPVSCGTVESATYPAESFDLVAALMVLEHLHDPTADAGKISSWIRPGGWFMGSVPNAGSWEFRAFGPRWFALQVPTHLSHFTSASLTRLLTESGFQNPQIVHQRNISNLMVHLGQALRRRGWPLDHVFLDFPVRGSRSLRLASWPLAALLAAVGQAGRMTFLAQKPG